MSSNRFCGFIVVRKPEFYIEEDPIRSLTIPPPCIDNICYGGIDRMRWIEISTAYYERELPDDLHLAYSAIKQTGKSFTGIELCYDLDTAYRLLAYSNKRSDNELIAVYSNGISRIHAIPPLSEPKTAFLGYDIVPLGWWSILEAGYFRKNDIFKAWTKYINRNGLFEVPDILKAYFNAYEIVSQMDLVEEIPELIYDVEAIEIHRVL